jgi:hypothetical protein
MTPFTAYPWLLGSYACVVALLLMWGCGSLRSLHLSERIPELVQCSLSRVPNIAHTAGLLGLKDSPDAHGGKAHREHSNDNPADCEKPGLPFRLCGCFFPNANSCSGHSEFVKPIVWCHSFLLQPRAA